MVALKKVCSKNNGMGDVCSMGEYITTLCGIEGRPVLLGVNDKN